MFLSGTVLFGFMHLAIALYIPHLRGWSDPPGKLVIVLNDIVGWTPYILSITFMVVGALTVFYCLWAKRMYEEEGKVEDDPV